MTIRLFAGRDRLLPLVGRTAELELMLGRWSQARDGSGQVLLVSAEPGIGKTRLVYELRRRLRNQAYFDIALYSAPYHSGTPLHPVADALGRALEFRVGDASEERLARLGRWLSELELTDAQDFASLARMLSLPVPSEVHEARHTLDEQRQLVFRTLERAILAMSQRQRVLLVVEDLDWVYPTTVDFLGGLFGIIRPHPVLVVATFRPEFDVPWRGLANLTSITLNHLTESECRALVLSAVSGSLEEERLSALVGRADGVPFFLEELSRGLGDGSDGESAIPETLRDALTGRLDPRRVSQALGSAGRGHWPAVSPQLATRGSRRGSGRSRPCPRGARFLGACLRSTELG